MFLFNLKATLQYWAGILSEIECKFSGKFSVFSLYSWSSRVCWTLLKSKSSPVPRLKISRTSCDNVVIMRSGGKQEKASPPNMWSQNEMLRRMILKWRAGCQFHHHLAWRRHLSTICEFYIGVEVDQKINDLNLKELLFDRAQKVKAWLDFSFRVVCLHIGGYHCNKPTFGCNLME